VFGGKLSTGIENTDIILTEDVSMAQHWHAQGLLALKKHTTLVSIRQRNKELNLRAQKVIRRKERARQDDAHASIIVMLMDYVLLQSSRLNQFIRGPNDLIAYTTRNLLECAIWCEFIKTGEAAVEQFYDDVFIEERELTESGGSEGMNMFDDVSDLTERLSGLEHYGLDPEKVIRALQNRILTAEGRRTTLKKREHRKFERHKFMVCSKYIHPSAWLLHQLNDVLTDDTMRRILLDYGLEYAEECVKECETA
jgi:hypothetical protein